MLKQFAHKNKSIKKNKPVAEKINEYHVLKNLRFEKFKGCKIINNNRFQESIDLARTREHADLFSINYNNEGCRNILELLK